MTMAKGLTSGYAPLGAVAMGEEIATFFAHKPFVSGLTYNSHPISLAAAIAVIEVMQEDQLVERAAQSGLLLQSRLAELQERHPSVGEVRSIGLFGAVELVRSRKTREPLAPYNANSEEMLALRKFLLDNGLFLQTRWQTVLIIPPLMINAGQLDEGFAILDKGLEITDAAVR